MKTQLKKQISDMDAKPKDQFDEIMQNIGQEFDHVIFLQKLSQKYKVKVGVLILFWFALNLFLVTVLPCQQFMVNLTGFIYPAYMTIDLINCKYEPHEAYDQKTQWLSYWFIFIIVYTFDFALHQMIHVVHLYYPLKCLVLIWLYYPKSQGAKTIYDSVLKKQLNDLINMVDQ